MRSTSKGGRKVWGRTGVTGDRDQFQSVIDRLEAANARLRSVNDEMRARNADATRLGGELADVLSSIEIPIVVVDAAARLQRFTPAAGPVFGLSDADVGRSIGEVASAFPASVAETVERVLHTLAPVETVIADDTGHWYQLTGRPHRSPSTKGPVQGVVITLVDVDRAKKAEALVVDALRYTSSIVDGVRDALIVLDPELRIRSVNRAYLRMCGGTADDARGRSLFEIAGGALDVPALRERLLALTEDEPLDGFCLSVDCPAAGRRVLVLDARRIEATRDVLLALEDATDTARADVATRRAEADMRLMLENATSGVLMVDTSGVILFANRTVSRIFGYPPGELLGLDVDLLVPAALRADHEGHRLAYATAPTSRPMAGDRDLVGVRKDGSEIPIEVALCSLDREDGRVVVCFVADVSQRRDAERRIRDYQDRLEQMAFDRAVAEERERRRIAIDLHDRIGQALALAQIKLTTARGADDAERRSIGEAIALVAQSIDDTRTLTFDLSPPVLYDLGLDEALHWLSEELEKRHGLRVDITDDAEHKPLDETTSALLFRAVRELLVNVVKHARSPRATVSLRRRGDAYEVAVEDEGVGFAPDARGTTRSGFGLMSVREQLRPLGGTMTVASAPRQGTRVSLSVPLRKHRSVPPPPVEGAETCAGPAVTDATTRTRQEGEHA